MHVVDSRHRPTRLAHQSIYVQPDTPDSHSAWCSAGACLLDRKRLKSTNLTSLTVKIHRKTSQNTTSCYGPPRWSKRPGSTSLDLKEWSVIVFMPLYIETRRGVWWTLSNCSRLYCNRNQTKSSVVAQNLKCVRRGLMVDFDTVWASQM